MTPMSSEANSPRSVVVAQVFPVKSERVDEFARHAERAFAEYRSMGANEVGVLTTLDVPNNYPNLPFRTDGPYLAWIGVVENDAILTTRLLPAALKNTDWLRVAPELIVLDPARRSRLRWLP